MTTITDPEATPAVQEHLSSNGGVLPHWKDGAPFAGASDRAAPVYDPATGVVTKQVALASAADADAVIASAAAAFPAWRDASLAKADHDVVLSVECRSLDAAQKSYTYLRRLIESVQGATD